MALFVSEGWYKISTFFMGFGTEGQLHGFVPQRRFKTNISYFYGW